MREIVLDTETTGLSALEGHRIIEIGAVELVNKYRTGKVYHTYVNPQRDISEGALKVHGITQEFLKDKPVFQLVVTDFLEFIGDSKLVIHNAPFDMGFINHHLNQLGVPVLTNDRVMDTLTYARRRYPGAKNSLDALCTRLNIDASARTHHGALLDAELLADVYIEMMGAGANQRNLMFQPAGAAGEAEAAKNSYSLDTPGKFREPRSFPASVAELKNHNHFVDTMNDPVWKKLAN